MVRAVVAVSLLSLAWAQDDSSCASQYGNARPANLPSVCWPTGSLSSEALDWSCSAACAEVFVPFWEACGETVLEISVVPGQDFAPFYDICRAGQIGRAATATAERVCNSDTYPARKAAVDAVCCPTTDGVDGGSDCDTFFLFALPYHCSLECAVIFSEYFEDCAAEIGFSESSDYLNQANDFYRTCIDTTDQAELLIVLSDMPQNGCSIDTSTARSISDHGMMAGGQIWLGSYICTQGSTGLQLQIVDVDPQSGVVNALFSFDTGFGSDSGCTGRYQLSGTLVDEPGGRPGTVRTLTLSPEGGTSSTEGWMENTCGYTSVGMTGTISVADNGDLIYQGTIDFNGCDTFLVTLPTQAPALFCPNTDAGWLLGSTMCYTRNEEAMSLQDAEEYCQGLDETAHVAVVPTLDDLNFLAVIIEQHGYHSYAIGATCPGTDKTLCDFLDGSAVTITPDGYCFEAHPDSVCDEPDDSVGNTQLGVNSNGLFDGSPSPRPFFCSMPPQPASSSRSCGNDLSGN